MGITGTSKIAQATLETSPGIEYSTINYELVKQNILKFLRRIIEKEREREKKGEYICVCVVGYWCGFPINITWNIFELKITRTCIENRNRLQLHSCVTLIFSSPFTTLECLSYRQQ